MELLLVPIDFSAGTEKVLATALQLAKATGAAIRLLHVAPPDPDFVPYDAGPAVVRDQVAHELRAEHRSLQLAAAELNAGGIKTSARMVMGPFVETIVEQADQTLADMIVIGSHGHGALFRMVLGSVSEGVVRQTDCPVLVVPIREG
jgi:nucleotide-binding universal stress UspA family protein